MAKRKYRVIDSFVYRGADGTSKKTVRIAPGEELPKLDETEIQRLLTENKICEVDLYGENITNKKLTKLTPEQVEKLFAEKGPKIISSILSTTTVDGDTLALMAFHADKYKFPEAVKQEIDRKISS